MFTAVVTLKCLVVLPCFSFPVNSTQSVYTQLCTKQTSTECYCRLRIVSDIQRKVSTGGQLVWQVWCALKVITYRKVCQVRFMMICRNMLYVSTRTVYVRRFRCSCCVLQAHLPSITAAGTQTHTKITYCVCVCDTALLRLATLTTVTYTSYSSVQHEHVRVSPPISVLPASNPNTY